MEDTVIQADKINDIKELFLFELDNELYAVTIDMVDRVMKIPPITPIPNAPRAIVGIFHLQGKVVVAIDLIRRMEIPKQRPLAATYLFVVRRAKDQFAILIDRPKMMLRVPVADIHPADPIIAAHVPPQYISGVFMYESSGDEAVHKQPSILIKGVAGVMEETVSTSPPRPVLWLDLEKLLSQDDLMRVFASQE